MHKLASKVMILCNDMEVNDILTPEETLYMYLVYLICLSQD